MSEIDFINETTSQTSSQGIRRFLTKNFHCSICNATFAKFVNINDIHMSCPYCHHEHCSQETIPINNPNEILRKRLLSKTTPFSVSPFHKSVSRSHLDFIDIFDEEVLFPPTENFFIDNYASNFISNFYNPISRIVFIQSILNKEDVSTPLQAKMMKRIKTFSLENKHCKVLHDNNNNDDNTFELPNCLLCLKDIGIGSKTCLLRCGHLFHFSCIDEWFVKHSVCPFCKYDAVKKSIYKSSIDIVNEKEEEKIENVALCNNKRKTGKEGQIRNINIQGENREYFL